MNNFGLNTMPAKLLQVAAQTSMTQIITQREPLVVETQARTMERHLTAHRKIQTITQLLEVYQVKQTQLSHSGSTESDKKQLHDHYSV